MNNIELKNFLVPMALIFMSGISGGKSGHGVPHPVDNPASPLMMDLPDVGVATDQIDFSKLPVLDGEHAVISRGDSEWHYRLHTYLVYFDGKFWCMWSHGPIVEDKPTQHIRYAVSEDGIHWIAYSRKKQTVEVVKVSLAEVVGRLTERP